MDDFSAINVNNATLYYQDAVGRLILLLKNEGVNVHEAKTIVDSPSYNDRIDDFSRRKYYTNYPLQVSPGSLAQCKKLLCELNITYGNEKADGNKIILSVDLTKLKNSIEQILDRNNVVRDKNTVDSFLKELDVLFSEKAERIGDNGSEVLLKVVAKWVEQKQAKESTVIPAEADIVVAHNPNEVKQRA